MSSEGCSEPSHKFWIAVAVAGMVFVFACFVNGWEVPWKSQVLFDCPPKGDGLYVELDPHEYQPDCKYFGPPEDER